MGGSTTPTFTPGKALLMGHETKMNMISPLASTSLFHADIETGKVVSEWSFQKDGVDVPIKDIVTDTKSAQVELGRGGAAARAAARPAAAPLARPWLPSTDPRARFLVC